MPLIIKNISKSYGSGHALQNLDLEVADQEFLALLGPSGSGKTTLLRVLAGLISPTTGDVTFNGADLLALSARERKAGMVFQHYALFRHMTVAANISFGLRVRPRSERPPADEIRRRTEELLRLVQLEGYSSRYPSQLSGGQRQRVALARALAIEPRMLLLDEPFGALDAKVRRELRYWLRKLHDETGVTTVFVTHDQEEALDLADRVAILNSGKIEQVGAPNDIYASPATPFVFDFLGAANEVQGEVRDGELHIYDARFPVSDTAAGQVTAFFRPHEVDINPADGRGFQAEVVGVIARGPATRLECLRGDKMMEIDWARGRLPEGVGRGAQIRLAPERFTTFSATTR